MGRRANGEGSICKRKDGYWIAQITLGKDKHGKLIRKQISGKTRKVVVEKLKEMQADQKTGKLVPAKRMTLKEWMLHWLINYKKLNVKESTYNSYTYQFEKEIEPELGYIQIQDLTSDILQRYIRKCKERGSSARTIRYNIFLINSSLKQAVKNRIVGFNIAENVVLPKTEKHDYKTWSAEQIRQFKQVNRDNRLYPAVLTQMGTGIRRGEVLGLRWQDIHFEDAYIEIKQHLILINKQLVIQSPKTKTSKRVIPLPQEVLNELKRHQVKYDIEKSDKDKWWNKEDLVFCSLAGTPLCPRNYQRAFNQMTKEAKLPRIRIHDLRHTFATQLVENDVDLKTVSELLGHTDARFTANVYTHPTMKMKTKAISKIDAIFSI